MTSILVAAEPAHFLTGLALLTLSAILCAALGGDRLRPAATWGLSALIALGLAEWCGLAYGFSTWPIVWQAARLALEIVALAGLIETGRLCTARPRGTLLPRWSYLVVAALAVAAMLLGRLNMLEFALRLAILWQAGWLARVYFTRGQTSTAGNAHATTIAAIGPSSLAVRVTVGALLVYLVSASIAIPRLGMLAALVAVVPAFVAFGPNPEKSRHAKLLWRCAWPVGFVLIAVGGCFALGAASRTESGFLIAELSEPADEAPADDTADSDSPSSDAGDDLAVETDSAADRDDASSQIARQAKRYGVGISPIILFVLFVWGLSRLPFVH